MKTVLKLTEITLKHSYKSFSISSGRICQKGYAKVGTWWKGQSILVR